MYLPDLVVRSRRVVTGNSVTPAAIHVRAGRIIGVLDADNVPEGCPLDDAGDLVVMPGAVDTHVHVNAPADLDGDAFERTTRAAAAGGVTTIVDMSAVGRPIASVSTLEQRRRAANQHSFVDVGFCGGIASGNAREIAPLAEAGVFGFACTFNENDLRTAMPALARIGATLMISGETATDREGGPGRGFGLRSLFGAGREYSRFLEAHPKEAETSAIQRVLELCREYGTRTHIVSLSSSDALTPIFRARAARLPVTVETCPQYLFFVAEEVPNGATAFACVPPVRERLNRELLWGALSGGLIQTIASDDSPPPAGFRKSRDFSRAWPGIASLQLSLPIVWTVASKRGHSLNQLAGWMCRAPSRVAGVEKKGEIDVGYDADLFIWNPDAEFVVDRKTLIDPGTRTPYAGCRLRGVIDRVYLRGHLICQDGRPIEHPMGRLIAKQTVSTARAS